MIRRYTDGSVAQLVRVPASHAGGPRFEPVRFHQQGCPHGQSLPGPLIGGGLTFVQNLNSCLETQAAAEPKHPTKEACLLIKPKGRLLFAVLAGYLLCAGNGKYRKPP